MLAQVVLLTTVAVAAAQDPAVLKQIPCGLPPFADKLPEQQQKDLKETWKEWKDGDVCVDQQKTTFKIVGTLSDTQKEELFGPPMVDDEFSVPEVPKFIQMITPEVKKEFDSIWLNVDLAEDEKHKQVEELATKKFTPEQLEDFKLWLAEMKKQKAAMDARLAKLSPKAKTAYDKLMKIRKEETKHIQSFTEEIQKELHGLY